MADLSITAGATSPGTLDPRQASAALLIKMSLEGKDFQSARREVEADLRAGEPTPPPAAGQLSDPVRMPEALRQLTVMEARIDQVAITVQSETAQVTVTATRTRVSVSTVQSAAAAAPKKDPLVIDLDGRGPTTTGEAGARSFDLAGDGRAQPTSFVSGGTALLALDRNGNGRFDDGGELFGDQHGAADGYEELAKFDANADRIIDRADPVFDRLRLWHADGSVTSLRDQGIASLSLSAEAAPGRTLGGDDILRRATATLESGARLGTYALALARFEAEA